jgi:hypothetical protein
VRLDRSIRVFHDNGVLQRSVRPDCLSGFNALWNGCATRTGAIGFGGGVNTVLMRGNVEAFGGFCEAMADWGFHELTFNALGGNERPEFFAANHLLPQQVRRFAAELPACKSEPIVFGSFAASFASRPVMTVAPRISSINSRANRKRRRHARQNVQTDFRSPDPPP